MVLGSSWPNPTSLSPGIAEGTYNAVYGLKGHRRKKPGVRLKNGGQIPTLDANPAQNNKKYAIGINIHCGKSNTWRGSAGCITIEPDKCQQVWDILQEGEKGTVILRR
ncbi:MAG: hypothetical protein LLF28_07095 [Nitrospiraceae bacterium]|nr:hypothetical protein [Nitrospiraceae bacterium]